MNITREEVTFSRCLLCTLRLSGVKQIPIAGDEYIDFIDRLQKVYDQKDIQFETIFVQDIFFDYQRIRLALLFNYDLIVPLAPYYREALIEMNEERARHILETERVEIGLTDKIISQIEEAVKNANFKLGEMTCRHK